MIPLFPHFRKLQLDDQEEINQLTSEFKYYSDFQFTSLWAWNLDDSIEVSTLDGNLLIKMRDYLTGNTYFSVCGKYNLDNTFDQLINFAQEKKLEPVLKYIPEEMLELITNTDRFKLSEDRDNFDYVFSVDDALLEDEKKTRRKYMRLFRNRYDPTVTVLDMTESHNQKLLVNAAREWTIKKDGNPEQLDNEIPALERLLRYLPDKLTVTAVFHEDKVVGFSVEEIIDETYATGHFQRIDYDYRRSFLFLNHQVNENLKQLGIRFVDVQQDAGDLELREKKLAKYNGLFFLKKYTISRH